MVFIGLFQNFCKANTLTFVQHFSMIDSQLNVVSTELPTQWGDFVIHAFEQEEGQPHLALVHPEANFQEATLIRIHSECLTGDIFHSLRCDCGEQLHRAMEVISKEKGILIYLRQEGRGIGLINKIKAYNLQDEGLDTAEANTKLGFEEDQRNYSVALHMLTSLKVTQVKLLTNNPKKLEIFDGSNIELVERIPLVIPSQPQNSRYLETKKSKFGHLI